MIWLKRIERLRWVPHATQSDETTMEMKTHGRKHKGPQYVLILYRVRNGFGWAQSNRIIEVKRISLAKNGNIVKRENLIKEVKRDIHGSRWR